MTITPAWVIQRKRDGEELSELEIREFIAGVSSGEIPDYQATAFLMAVYFKGMTPHETVALTRAMLESGIRNDLTSIAGSKVDKHSTGGVGDKVSIVLAPLAAACGLKVPMMAGRGLGHSGGTIDKLEAIPGYRASLSPEEFKRVLSDVGCVIVGQSEKIAPADKKLYALRDVTATVECIPLIVASILSKKLAEGTGALVMDVKVGSGAFMKTKDQARKLGKALVQVARKMGLPCRVLITDMNQPLGSASGNALEIVECIEMMTGQPVAADFRELTLQLCAQMLQVGGLVKNVAEGRKLATRKLEDGSAWKLFLKMIEAQGGSAVPLLDTAKFPTAGQIVKWKAWKRGYLSKMDTQEIGRLLVDLGAGRKKASDPVDPSVGFIFHKKLGARVASGEALVTVHASASTDLAALEARFRAAVEITASRKPVPKLVLETF